MTSLKTKDVDKFVDVRLTIKITGMDLQPGETKTIICPFCEVDYDRQGQPKNTWVPTRSMSITRDNGGIKYYCHRASCTDGHRGGFVQLNGMPSTREIVREVLEKQRFTADKYDYPLFNLMDDQVDWFQKQFGINRKQLTDNRIQYNPYLESYAFPIFDKEGEQVGITDRSYTGRVPKAKNYWFKDVPNKLHFPRHWNLDEPAPPRQIVLVEDTLSAIKVARYSPCIALLGCSFNHKDVIMVKSLTDVLIMALDRDAFDNALSFKKQYEAAFKVFRVVSLLHDPKDMNDMEILGVFGWD